MSIRGAVLVFGVVVGAGCGEGVPAGVGGSTGSTTAVTGSTSGTSVSGSGSSTTSGSTTAGGYVPTCHGVPLPKCVPYVESKMSIPGCSVAQKSCARCDDFPVPDGQCMPDGNGGYFCCGLSD